VEKMSLELTVVLAVIFASAILGSLKFMWDIRHPKV